MDSSQAQVDNGAETTCRICGFDDAGTILWQYGFPTYIICDCCGNEPDGGDLLAQLAQIGAPWRGTEPPNPLSPENVKHPYPVDATGAVVESRCRVCAWDDGTVRWTAEAIGTGAVCDCCGSRSGHDDIDTMQVWERRGAWAETLGPWYRPQARPAGWDLATQIRGFPEAVMHQKTGAAKAREREAEYHKSLAEIEEMKRQLGLS